MMIVELSIGGTVKRFHVPVAGNWVMVKCDETGKLYELSVWEEGNLLWDTEVSVDEKIDND